LDDAFGIEDKIPPNARIIRNLILGSNFLQSHLLHFYHLAIPDYVDLRKAVGEVYPFIPSYEGDYRLSPELNTQIANNYIKALDIRRISHEMLAVFGGKMPHNVGIVVGGVTMVPTVDRINDFKGRLMEISDFIENTMIPDVLSIAKEYRDYFETGEGCRNFLSYGGFLTQEGRFLKAGIVNRERQLSELEQNNINEYVKYSWYADLHSGKRPSEEDTIPEPKKQGGYSFIKSPRYKGEVYEVGPLARFIVNYAAGHREVKKILDPVLEELSLKVEDLPSVMGRHLARCLESKIIADVMASWVEELNPGEPAYFEADIPEEGEGSGLSEAPRGSCGHWVKIEDKKIARYQVVTPTAWNGSPKDDKEQPGPIEQALLGTKIRDESNPFELVRIVRAFDPCLACAIHLIDSEGRDLGEYIIA